MSKKIFRYLTGEINGALASALHNFLNDYIDDVYDTLAYTKNVVFKLESEDITGTELPMREDDIFGIGKIAGVFVPYISQESNSGCLVFTKSHKVNGTEYSDRGLLNRSRQVFFFNRTDDKYYPDNGASLATVEDQASIVPHGAPVLGYIWYGDTVLEEDGTLIESAIRQTKPTDGTPYMEFYGPQYLILSQTFIKEAYLDVATYKQLFEEMQKIRYNGVSIVAILALKDILVSDYVWKITLTTTNFHVVLTYKLNEDSLLADKKKRLYIWKTLMASKFKQIVLQEETAQ